MSLYQFLSLSSTSDLDHHLTDYLLLKLKVDVGVYASFSYSSSSLVVVVVSSSSCCSSSSSVVVAGVVCSPVVNRSEGAVAAVIVAPPHPAGICSSSSGI